MIGGISASGTTNADSRIAANDHSPYGRRILVYAMNYAPEMAGVGRYTGEIAEYLAREGADTRVVTTPPHYPGWVVLQGYRNWYSVSRENGVAIKRVPLLLRRKMGGIWRLFAPLTFAITSMPVVLYEIIRWRPEIIYCVEPTLFAAPVAQFAAQLVGARTVLHVQDLEVDAAFSVGHLNPKSWMKRLGLAYEKFTLSHFDMIITISDRMAEKLCEKGVRDERLAIVRNWVDLSHINPMTEESPYRAELGFAEEDFVVLYSGNIGAKQELDVLLDAAEILRDKTRIKFVVAGEGPAKADLENRYGHLPNLRFLPFQPYARLNEFLNMPNLHALMQGRGVADLVLPSKLGGMLASGKSIIVTADPDTELAEFLGDAAIVTPPGDARSLADAIAAAKRANYTSVAALAERAQKLSRADGLKALTTAIGGQRRC